MPGEFESTGGIDPTDFASDLFPDTLKTAAPETSEPSSAAVSSPDHTSPSGAAPSTAQEASGLTPAAWDAMPKSWKKEREADWKEIKPSARQYIHEREQQVTQGISQYRGAAEQWNKVVSPFSDILAQYPDANMVEILSTLAANHMQMIQATPAERRAHALVRRALRLRQRNAQRTGDEQVGQQARDHRPGRRRSVHAHAVSSDDARELLLAVPFERGLERLEDRRVMAFDLVSAYAASDTPFFVAGQPAAKLTDEELLGTCMLLMIAGHETTVNLLEPVVTLTVEPTSAPISFSVAAPAVRTKTRR